MAFTVPCIVRCSDADSTAALLNWCKEIGYFELAGYSAGRHNVVAVTDQGVATLAYKVPMGPYALIDCGDNVPLFKALAAINDATDRHQWFVDARGVFVQCRYDNIREFVDRAAIRGYDIGGDWLHKATGQELIKHFNSNGNE